MLIKSTHSKFGPAAAAADNIHGSFGNDINPKFDCKPLEIKSL